jgi:RNA-directed DNA polymerase
MSSVNESPPIALHSVAAWDNLLAAWRQAARGKRRHTSVAHFEHRMANRLLGLRQALLDGTYRPGAYTHFTIREPKRRVISAAPFRDRVVHHALCNVIEPAFERRFIPDSYANRLGKGTHRALDRFQGLARRYPYVLRLDIRQHFPSIDHAILLEGLARVVPDEAVLDLCRRILASGEGVLDQEYTPVYFPGDDLLAVCRPRGLPIGNLTSQFWSNCYLHPLDLFVKRELGCAAYLRYVDDFALFADERRTLWRWKRAVVERLATLRLTVHEGPAQVVPVTQGVPWLGLVVFPDRRRVKGRNVRRGARRLGERFEAWRAGRISFAAFDASVQGWIEHVRHADTWGLRERVLAPLVWGPEDIAREKARQRRAAV